MKKLTKWITIPEKNIEAPASNAKGESKSNKKSGIQNKMFWGIGFIVLIFATFVALAPQQFSTLLKGDVGSLFDSSGISEDEMGAPLSPLGLLPSVDEEAEEAQEEAEIVPDSAEEAEAEDVLVVEAEADAVSISIEPLGPINCGSDTDCFYAKFEDCTLSAFAGEVAEGIEFEIEITEAKEANCITHYKNTANPDSDFVDTEMTCDIAMGTYDEQAFLLYMEENQEDGCSGSFIDRVLMLKAEALAIEKEREAAEEAGAIEALNREIEALKVQKELQDQALQDLAELVQADQVHAAAPTGVTTTATIGQPTIQPDFRVNTHVVSKSPQQVLQQNLDQDFQVFTTPLASAQIPQTTYQPVQAGETPQTGPEVWVIALISVFLGLIGYKTIKVIA